MQSAATSSEFARYARLLTQAKGDPVHLSALALARGVPDRVKYAVEKADPGMIAPGASPGAVWGYNLFYENMATAFIGSLAPYNSFDAAFLSMMHVPLKSRVMISLVAAEAFVVDEGDAKTPTELDLSDQSLETLKAAAMIVVTNDLLKLGGPVAQNLFESELRKGVSKATAAKFEADLKAATTPGSSSGDFLWDLRTLLGEIDGDVNSRYFVVVDSANLKMLATAQGLHSSRAYPELGVNGGTIGGITIVGSSSLTSGDVIAFDAARIAADAGTVVLDASIHGNIDMAGGNSPNFSLFQKNATALRAERWFGFKATAGSVSSLTGADYAGQSPA